MQKYEGLFKGCKHPKKMIFVAMVFSIIAGLIVNNLKG